MTVLSIQPLNVSSESLIWSIPSKPADCALQALFFHGEREVSTTIWSPGKGGKKISDLTRILGDSGFVSNVLEEAGEKFERRYEMKRLGYKLTAIEERVCEIYNIERDDIYSRSREKDKSNARALIVIGRLKNSDMPKDSWPKNWGLPSPG